MRKYWKEKNRYIAEKEKSADAGIKRMMLTSVLGMLICVVCLAGTTWAWFTATQNAMVADSMVASFDVQVKIGDAVKENVEGNETGTYIIDTNKCITVTLYAVGNAKGGYCKITVDGEDYYTGYITSENSYMFTVCAANNTIKISPKWKKIELGTPIEEKDYIGEGKVPETSGEKMDNSNNKDAVINKEENNGGNDITPAQGSDDNNSDDNNTPAQKNTTEQGGDSESGTSETHAAE